MKNIHHKKSLLRVNTAEANLMIRSLTLIVCVSAARFYHRILTLSETLTIIGAPKRGDLYAQKKATKNA